MKINQKSLLPYWIGLGVIALVLIVMFYPALSGKVIHQEDIQSHKGMSRELNEYYNETGSQAFWTNSMFSGMPAYLISMRHNSNLLLEVSKALKLYLPFFMGVIFLIFAGFFFMTRVLKIDPWISILGSLAFVLSSYFYIILDVGHNSKANAIAYMAPFLGAMILTYRRKLVLGAILSAFFLALEISANHLQITYYLAFIALIYVVFEFVWALLDKKIMNFLKASGLLLAGAALAIAINFSLLYTAYEYSKETIRGKSELTSKSLNQGDGDGLDTDYLTRWSYGIGETWSLMIPNVKGGASLPIGEQNEGKLDNVSVQNKQIVGSLPQYWGEQPGTSGPVYVGAIVIFLFVFALFLTRNKIKWPLLVAMVLSILLAWGKHFPVLTNFFINYVPMYNKFRAPSMWLVVAELIIPFIMVLGIHELITNREKYFSKINWLYISFGLTGGLALIFWLMPETFFSFSSEQDQYYINMFMQQGATQPQIDSIVSDWENVRIAIFKADAIRSFLFILAAAVFVWLYLKKYIKAQVLLPALIILVFIDMIPVNKRYLDEKDFISKRKYQKPYTQTLADQMILQQNATQDRVLNLTVSTFNDASTSYFHHSIGGYHAAKLMRYQELIENQINPEINVLITNLQDKNMTMGRLDTVLSNLGVLNMLNTRYIIINPNGPPLVNRHALGQGWFVNDIVWADNADQEIELVGQIDPSHTAVVDKRFKDQFQGLRLTPDSGAAIIRKTYLPDEVSYVTNSTTLQLAVFSEIFYPEWEATVDGQPAEIIRVNYVLRGIVLPAGSHEVVMIMNPKIYKSSSKVSLAGSIIMILIILGYIAREYMINKKKTEGNIVDNAV